jgi:hypothetical protein
MRYEVTVAGTRDRQIIEAACLDEARQKAKREFGIIRHVKAVAVPGHSVWNVHAFASVCHGCDVHTRCVRFSSDNDQADYCQACFKEGAIPEEFRFGLYCDDCIEPKEDDQ